MTDKNELMMLEPAARGLDLNGNPLPIYEKAPNAPLGHVPPRRPGSIRRTMSIDVDWPTNVVSPSRFRGRARDILTPLDGSAPIVLAEDAITGGLEQRAIAFVEGERETAALAQLAGERAGSNLRAALDRLLHAEKVGGSPLYLLLDDLAGASLVCMWGWSRWNREYLDAMRKDNAAFHISQMEGVCIGFRPGSTALTVDIREGSGAPNSAKVPSLVNPEDPAGWHELPSGEDGPHFRRARLVDIWREGDVIHVWALFQDSSSSPEDRTMREAIHEYRISATADAQTGALLTLEATPGTLPHAECPAAMANIGLLLDTPMDELRDVVLEKLKRTAGCTHLNDMIRSLAEVPILAEKLPA
jgi:hypothetical protein